MQIYSKVEKLALTEYLLTLYLVIEMTKDRPYTRPSFRPLAVFAFDPSLGRQLNNYMTIKVPFEALSRGPVGRKVAVVDYDISNNCFYHSVDLENPLVLTGGGLSPAESDPRFHQQMVYAVASETLRRFEFALGRQMKWRTSSARHKARHQDKLRLFPHAFQQANAFYEPTHRAIFFGYFAASESDPGSNLPGQTIFTCLSHDIIAHEVTHAIVDGVRPLYIEATNADTPAFHEAFADIVALFQHFSMRDAVFQTIRRTGGLLYRETLDAQVAGADSPAITAEMSQTNPLVGLAQQFGEAMGMRAALRSALGTPPNSQAIQSTFEPHLRGAILVAALFDAYFSIYVKRSKDLLRMARTNGTSTAFGELDSDLAQRLCNEATKTANHMLNICIRALDYCPPVDVRFGEFLRAIITADSDLVPDDPWGYRAEIIKAFRLRGIVPDGVDNYSEEALLWRSPSDMGMRSPPPCQGLQYDILRDDALRKTDKIAADDDRILGGINFRSLWDYAMANARVLGLTPPKEEGGARIQVVPHPPIHRIGPDGRLVINLIAQFLQQRKERLDPDDKKSPTFKFRGGSTVIFNHRGEVRYVIQKNINRQERLDEQRDYQSQLSAVSAASIFKPNELCTISFAAMHRAG